MRPPPSNRCGALRPLLRSDYKSPYLCVAKFQFNAAVARAHDVSHTYTHTHHWGCFKGKEDALLLLFVVIVVRQRRDCLICGLLAATTKRQRYECSKMCHQAHIYTTHTYKPIHTSKVLVWVHSAYTFLMSALLLEIHVEKTNFRNSLLLPPAFVSATNTCSCTINEKNVRGKKYNGSSLR